MRKLLKSTFNVIFPNYEVYARTDLSKTQQYSKLEPKANYSPWFVDEAFKKAYSIVKKHTLVDIYRCYELWDLITQAAKLPKGDLIEIGVWQGGSGGLIASQAKNHNIKNKVYLCDTFKGVVKASDRDNHYIGGEHNDTSKDITIDLIKNKLHLDNVEILQGIFPDETGHLLQDKQFRFCHIDVDVYDSAKDIINWLWDKLVVGGIVVYDDYGFDVCAGVTKYVNEQKAHNDRLVFYNLNGHAIIIKIK